MDRCRRLLRRSNNELKGLLWHSVKQTLSIDEVPRDLLGHG